MPIPATLTSYLPILLASATNAAAPDDSSFATLPQGQVDYLSHEWREQDVWQSWRNMTRQKNAIANGMRLENASWRTWWKQRNKLKTISPETLNWLKDSDVTWLYGPLHVGSDWAQISEHKPESKKDLRKNSFDTISPTPPPSGVTKPILKRRSISQLLSLPASPFFDQESDEHESDLEEDGELLRPPLLHTKSDTHISWRSRPYRKDSPPRIIAPAHPPSHPDFPELHEMAATSSGASNSTGSDQDLSANSADGPGTDSTGGAKKRHISFNTFVEQCIAIEKPKSKRKSFVGSRNRFFPDSLSDDGYDEDSEVGYEDESDGPSSFFLADRSGIVSDSEDDDDDVLEMRTSSSRSRSSSSSRSRHGPLSSTSSPSFTATSRNRPSIVRTASMDRERVTIAPIAPTILKTTGVGNELTTIGEVTPVPKDVELVYVPPTNSIYSLPSTPQLGAGAVLNEDIYTHRESYFSIAAGHSSRRSLSAGSSPMITDTALPSTSSAPIPYDPSKNVLTNNMPSFFGRQQPIVDSPMHTDDITAEVPNPSLDAYDYFGGPDLGEDYTVRRHHSTRRRRSLTDVKDDDDGGGVGIVRYAHGGAASVTIGRSSGSPNAITQSWTASPNIPSVIVNEVSGALEERTDESLLSASPTTETISGGAVPITIKTSPSRENIEALGTAFAHRPSSSAPIAVIGGPHPSIQPPVPIHSHISPVRRDSDPSYLSPPENSVSSRGRSPLCSSHSQSTHSGSTTTGSYTHSSDSRSESRGRSSTRNSSFSDHERSGSRGSRGTNSPIGSISPTGSAIGIVGSYGSYTAGRGRERETRIGGVHGGKTHRSKEDGERGRERTGRRLGDSKSPPSTIGSPSRSASDMEAYQPYSPELLGGNLEKPSASTSTISSSPPSSVSGSISGSSTAGSTATIVVPTPQVVGNSGDLDESRPRIGISLPNYSSTMKTVPIPIPSPIPEEEETRSRQPTPANSPVSAFHPATAVFPLGLKSPNPTPKPVKSAPSQPVTSPSEAIATTSPPESPGLFRANTAEKNKRNSFDGGEVGQQQNLVSRAAEIVSSARGLWGSIWNNGSS